MKLFLALVCITTLSAASSKAETLDWQACVKEAALGNPDLHIAQDNLRSTELLERGAYSGFFPQITGNLGYNNSGPAAGAAGQNNPLYSASLSATQNLFSGFLDKARVAQAGATEEISRGALALAKAKASVDLKTAFANLLYAQNAVLLARDIIRRRQENLNIVQLQFEGGQENRGSFLLSKANLSSAKFDELQARQNIAIAQEQLAKVLGKDNAEVLEITGTVPVAEPAATVDFRTIAVLTPDHQQAVAQENVANAAVVIARSQFFPSLALSGGLNRAAPAWFPQNETWSAGISLTLPLFNGGKDYYNTKSAVALRSSATFNLSSVDKQLLVRLRTAYYGYEQAVELLKVDEEFVTAALTRAEIGRNKYNNGLMTFEDWDLIENDLIARQKSVLQAKQSRVTSEAAWEQVQGKGVIP